MASPSSFGGSLSDTFRARSAALASWIQKVDATHPNSSQGFFIPCIDRKSGIHIQATRRLKKQKAGNTIVSGLIEQMSYREKLPTNALRVPVFSHLRFSPSPWNDASSVNAGVACTSVNGG